MRSDTVSLPVGKTDALCGTVSTGLVVAFLKAASARSMELIGRRVGGLAISIRKL
jgi:hypothetical protein